MSVSKFLVIPVFESNSCPFQIKLASLFFFSVILRNFYCLIMYAKDVHSIVIMNC